MGKGCSTKSRDRLAREPAGPKKWRQEEPAAALLPRTSKRLVVVLCLALAVATLAVYWQTSGHGFIAYDDDQYVYENSTVKAGLTASGIAWAFTTFFYANWHPLTWLSHMLDCQLFGVDAGAHHIVNVAFHLANTLLLFIAFARMTRQPWRSALVAGIFALHPLHVESVAWIAERKDVLSTFFAMLTLLLYAQYAENTTAWRYISMAVAFALGLMAKPMLVTFPFVLLLLDFWPLRRLEWPPAWPTLWPLLWEKAPLFAMAAVSSVLTFLAQQNYGAVIALARMPFSARIANAAIAYVSYLGKAFWPAGLAVLYPLQRPQAENALGALAILAGATAVALLRVNRRPYLLVGWLWYLGMLVPVIGLVQAGVQSMADRYTYLPLVGLSVAIVWSTADLVESHRLVRNASAALAAVVLVLAVASYQQAAYWKTSRTLFEHTLAVTNGNYIIHNNLGVILAREGRRDEAIGHYREALAISPDYAEAHANLGTELLKSGKFDEAFSNLVEALRLKPDQPMAQSGLGVLLAARGNFEEARLHLQESLRLSPENPEGHSNLCFVFQRMGRFDEAIAHCSEALRLKPELLDARFNLGTALAAQGKKAEAVAELSRVLAANPRYAAARAALEQLQGREHH
jgi:tetratricopeptide (TPR) repeat protein